MCSLFSYFNLIKGYLYLYDITEIKREQRFRGNDQPSVIVSWKAKWTEEQILFIMFRIM